MTDVPALTAKRSYRDGCVSVSIRLRCGGNNHDHARIDASTELTTTQARTFALELAARADAEDEKVAASEAKKASRKKWLDREVAAGRMKVLEWR